MCRGNILEATPSYMVGSASLFSGRSSKSDSVLPFRAVHLLATYYDCRIFETIPRIFFFFTHKKSTGVNFLKENFGPRNTHKKIKAKIGHQKVTVSEFETRLPPVWLSLQKFIMFRFYIHGAHRRCGPK